LPAREFALRVAYLLIIDNNRTEVSRNEGEASEWKDHITEEKSEGVALIASTGQQSIESRERCKRMCGGVWRPRKGRTYRIVSYGVLEVEMSGSFLEREGRPDVKFSEGKQPYVYPSPM
jgi:hypothetical protein